MPVLIILPFILFTGLGLYTWLKSDDCFLEWPRKLNDTMLRYAVALLVVGYICFFEYYISHKSPEAKCIEFVEDLKSYLEDNNQKHIMQSLESLRDSNQPWEFQE